MGCAFIVLLLSLPRLIFSARYGLIGDEAYYAIWSFYPGFGYFDHSPAVAWVIWLGRAVFGESEFAVRSLFFVAGLLAGAALYRIGSLLANDARVGAAAAIAYTVTPGILLTFAVATPDGPSTLCWLLALWAVAEFIRGRNPNWWLIAGLVTGLGLLSKYTVVFLGPGFVLYLLTSRERLRWLRHWQVWVGGLLALALFAPVVWVDMHRGWSSFRFQLGRSSLADHHFAGLGEFVRFLVEESIQLVPTLFLLMIAGAALYFARRARGLALPVLTSAPMVLYFLVHAVFGRVNPNWTAPLFPPLALIGAWAAVTLRPSQAILAWPLAALRALHVPLGIAVMLLGLAAVEYRALPLVGPLPVFDYVYGWDDLQQKVSELAHDKGAEWVDTQDYSLNGWLGYYGRIAHDPLPVYQTNSPGRYRYMPPMDKALKKAPHLLVYYDLGGKQPKVAGAEPLGRVARTYDGKDLAAYWVWFVP